jgi:hypothetical protein
MESEKHYIVGIFDNEHHLLHGVKNIREAGVKIQEVFTPYPVHGLDEELGYKRSKLPIAAFMFGALGTSLALLMQIWMMGFDWPMIVGGKNYVSLPSFIPVTFELTVLLSALGMVGVFMVVSDLKPYKKVKTFDIRSTDDKFVMAVDLASNRLEKNQITQILSDNHAIEVYYKEFEQ